MGSGGGVRGARPRQAPGAREILWVQGRGPGASTGALARGVVPRVAMSCRRSAARMARAMPLVRTLPRIRCMSMTVNASAHAHYVHG